MASVPAGSSAFIEPTWPQGATLSLVVSPTWGRASILEGGRLLYAPRVGYSGQDSFAVDAAASGGTMRYDIVVNVNSDTADDGWGNDDGWNDLGATTVSVFDRPTPAWRTATLKKQQREIVYSDLMSYRGTTPFDLNSADRLEIEYAFKIEMEAGTDRILDAAATLPQAARDDGVSLLTEHDDNTVRLWFDVVSANRDAVMWNTSAIYEVRLVVRSEAGRVYVRLLRVTVRNGRLAVEAWKAPMNPFEAKDFEFRVEDEIGTRGDALEFGQATLGGDAAQHGVQMTQTLTTAQSVKVFFTVDPQRQGDARWLNGGQSYPITYDLQTAAGRRYRVANSITIRL